MGSRTTPGTAIQWNEWIDCKPKWPEYRASSTKSPGAEPHLRASSIRGMPVRTNCLLHSERPIALLRVREVSNPSKGRGRNTPKKGRNGRESHQLNSTQ